jgi:hypothetical protein
MARGWESKSVEDQMRAAEAEKVASSKTFKTTIVRDGSTCFIPLSFDPKSVFGKIRTPVKVTLNGYTFRSTIAAMGGPPCIPLRKSNRKAAGLEGGETLEVRLDLDTEKRDVEPPADFVTALKATPPAWERWQDLSYTHKREHVEAIEEAKKPETRVRRIERAVRTIRGMPNKKSR